MKIIKIAAPLPSGYYPSKIDQGKDQQYLEAVENYDVQLVEQMANDKRQMKMYNIGPLQHETPYRGFILKPGGDNMLKSGPAIWLGNYGGESKAGHNLPSNGDFVTRKLYAEMLNPLDITGKEGLRNAREKFTNPELAEERLQFSEEEFPYLITTDIISKVNKAGHDGIILSMPGQPIEYLVFSSDRVKLADPVTFADDGQVIPLSQRYEPSSQDIRY